MFWLWNPHAYTVPIHLHYLHRHDVAHVWYRGANDSAMRPAVWFSAEMILPEINP